MNIRSFICIVLAVTLIAGSSYAVPAVYDVYKYSQDGTKVPDVDKAGVPPGPPAGNDKSCWLATASNILAGAGWGPADKTAQQNADAIYGILTNHFTTLNAGSCPLAVNWWLYNYGYNPSEANSGWYDPNNHYSDVTAISKTLTNVDYDFLLGELQRCQYVGVTWELSSSYHCMTLAGGNWSVSPTPKSVWHDSDRDNPGPDDVYTNAFAGDGSWTLSDYQTFAGVGYVTLCPGLVKPASAMNNYDAAYFKDQDANGNEFINHRVVGSATYGDPNWETSPTNGKYTILHIPNEIVPQKHKEVYLLVDYLGRAYDPNHPENAPDINLMDANENMYNDPNVTISPDGGQIMYHWTLIDQPVWEQIIFPSEDYYTLSGDVKDFDIATECIPEPVGLAIILSGSMILLRRRRR